MNILAADKLMQAPKLYATFLLWLLAELFERLPEVGDPEKPKVAFFFDEAHLLFEDAPDALLDKIEQVVRLVRSKGVGVYFCSQNPLDIPEKVLGQLGNRVQHALRAFTPRDQKAVKAAAETFRANPALDVATVIMELAVGEALISFLDAKGTPGHRAAGLGPAPRQPVPAPGSRPAQGRDRPDSPLAGHYEKAGGPGERLRAPQGQDRDPGPGGGPGGRGEAPGQGRAQPLEPHRQRPGVLRQGPGPGRREQRRAEPWSAASWAASSAAARAGAGGCSRSWKRR